MLAQVTGVEFLGSSDETYGFGVPLRFGVTFDGPVTISNTDTNATTVPRLSLTVGGKQAFANYDETDAGNSPTKKIFTYRVGAGDVSADGILVAGSVLPNGDTITATTGGADVTLTFVPLSLPLVKVDGVAAEIVSVTPPADGRYTTGRALAFTVNYNEPVVVVGSPRLPLRLGSNANNATAANLRNAVYDPATSTSTALKFTYVLQATDVDSDGIVLNATSLDLNGATIRDQAGTNATLTLPTSLPATAGILANPPVIQSIIPSPNGSYGLHGATKTVSLTVRFDRPVSVTGSPRIELLVGGAQKFATYQAGTGTTDLRFEYPVVSGDLDTDGITILGTGIVLNGGTIKDVGGNDPVYTLPTPLPTTSGILVDGVANTITTVAVPADGRYTTGQTLAFTVNYNEPVVVVGTPLLSFLLGPNADNKIPTSPNLRNAVYDPATSTPTALKFTYVLQATDVDSDGIVLDTAPLLAGNATIRDAAGTNANTNYSGLATTGIFVNARAPAVVAVDVPASRDYVSGDVLEFTVTYDTEVTVTGVPRLKLQLNINQATQKTANAYASFSSIDASQKKLTFRFTVTDADLAKDGLALPGLLDVNGGAIQNADKTVTASLALPVTPTLSTVRIPARVTTLNGLPAASTASPQATPVTALTITAPNADAKTPIVNADVDLTHNGARVELFPASGTSARLTPAALGNTYVLDTLSTFTKDNGTYVLTVSDADDNTLFTYTWIMDGDAPTLLSVTGPTPKTYVAGDVLRFRVTFDESVRVAGTPRIAITIGTVTRYASYVVGSETPQLVFEYQILSGDFDSDGIVPATEISLNGGTITDLSGNIGKLNFPAISSNAVLVDAVQPVVSRFSVPASLQNGFYKAGAVIPVEATMSRPVAGGSALQVTLDTGAVVVLSAPGPGTLLTGTYKVAAGENSADLTVMSFIDVSITDAVGNKLGSTVVPTGINNIGGARAIVIDTVPPSSPVIVDVIDDVAPVIGGVAIGGFTNDATPTINGSADPFATVTLTDGIATIGTGSANAGGEWSITPSKLVDRAYLIAAVASDMAGNTKQSSTSRSLTVDTVAPAVPTVHSIVSGVITGGAEPGATITVRRTGSALGTTTTDSNGKWTYVLGLVDGVYSISALATDAAGNASSPTSPTQITLDTIAPDAPSITSVTDDVQLLVGVVLNGSRTNDATPTVSGNAEPGSTVTLLSNDTVVGTTVATKAGVWSITPTNLVDGPHAFTATATDASLNTSVVSLARSVLIDTIAPQQPGITTVTDNVGPLVGDVARGGATNDPTPTFGGTAEAGVEIRLMSGSIVLGTTTADGAGLWSITSLALTDGSYALIAAAYDLAGNASSAVPYPLTIDTIGPTAPVISVVDSDLPLNPGTVLSGGVTNDNQLRITGQAEANARVTFWTNYGTTAAVNSVVIADAAGKWSVSTPVLPDGQHLFSALVRDAAFNRSPLSAAWTVTVDTAAPRVLAISSTLPSGTYGVGQAVDVQVRFTKPVVITGTPALRLNTSPARYATFVGVSGDTATFRYVSVVGDVATRLDYADAAALALGGGVIRDVAGNAANLALPVPGTPESLAGSTTIAVDCAIKASAGTLSTDPATAPQINRSRRSIPITFNTPVTGFTVGSIKLFFEGRSVSLAGATLTGSGASYVLNLPTTATSLKGLYRLRIGGQTAGIMAGDVAMSTPANLYWKRI